MISSTPRGPRRLHVLAALVGLVGLVAPVSLGVAAASASTAHPTASERVPAPRYIVVTVTKKQVVKGKKVTIRGSVQAPEAPACAAGVTLDLERSTRGAIYKTIGHVTTDLYGAYTVRSVVNKKSRFRLSVAATDACTEAQSPPRTVSIKPKG